MSRTTHRTRRHDLGDFLRRRRESLTPAAAGLPGGGRRRTPGLRRDEVAVLANMSAVYYERLEQGRGPQPSATMLSSLARALQLNDDERGHLYRLAGQAAPPAPEPAGYVDPSLLAVLQAAAATAPGFISDELGTVVAQNSLNIALFGEFAGRPGWQANLIWLWFTSAEWRRTLEPESQHEQTGRAYVADLRAITGGRDHDPRAAALVADLRAASADFAGLWDRHEVSVLHCATKRVEHREAGRLDLDCSVTLSPLSRQRMLLLHPVPGTGTDERLARLAATLSGPVAALRR
ncbi:helix-turn-helix transcriptional regulator [Actinoplanes auranticolor]|uniref:XRE family transcriptional regulator n=1 Tax=Actinoplanes auranticolor TaxID=47988 RepID=A0A919SA16_9ACTN|nr:helix-turn-helix transcriptional regulator [Actinoplanes auranticolor]GIM66558.1 XRE family transcriptional regulator [Actinoplanes auranticolor]